MPDKIKTVDDLNPEIMKVYGSLLDSVMPQGAGYALIVFPFGAGLRSFRYVSNAQRSDMIGALEAILLKWKREEADGK